MRLRLTALGAALAMLAGVAAVRADTLGELRAGNAAFGEGRFEAAVEAYTRAILAGDLEPGALAVAFNNRGVAYGELDDHDRAIRDYEQALDLRSGDATARRNLRIGHVRRAIAAVALREYDQALADYDRAAGLDPAHAPTFLQRGRLRLTLGEPGPAAADLRRALELDPAGAEARGLLARAEADLAAAAASPPPAAGDPGPAVAGSAPGAAEAIPPEMPDPAAGGPDVTAAPQNAGPLPPVRVAEGPERRFRVLQPVRMREGPGNEYPQVGFLAGDAVVAVVGESRSWLLVRLPDGRRGFVYERFLEPAPG